MTSPSERDAPARARRHLAAVTGTVGGVSLAVFGILLLLVTAPWGPLIRLDESVAETLNQFVATRPWLVDGLNITTDVFAPWVFRVAGLIVAIALLLRSLPRLALWVFVTVWAGGLIVAITKILTERPRPTVPEDVSDARGYAFPSGHALGATVGCTVLLALLWPMLSRRGRVLATAAAVTVAVLTSFSRVALGVHFTSDVIAGMALGLAWVAAATAVLRPWGVPDERTALDRRGTRPRDAGDVR